MMNRFMIRLSPRALGALLVVGALAAASATTASAQSNDQSGGFLGGLFGSDQGSRRDQAAQSATDELSVRVDRLEAQVRQMTGTIEELQFQLRRLQGDAGNQPVSAQQPVGQQLPPPQSSPPPRPGAAPPPAPGQRRGDAFDPSQNPNAPGAPRTLGTVAAGPGLSGPSPDQVAVENAPAPGGREPLNLSNASANANPNPGPQAGGDGRGTQLATLPPSDSPKDYYDLAYGYVMRRDYALASDAFRAF